MDGFSVATRNTLLDINAFVAKCQGVDLLVRYVLGGSEGGYFGPVLSVSKAA